MSKNNRGRQLKSRFIVRDDYETKKEFEKEIQKTMSMYKQRYPECRIVIRRNKAGAGVNAFEKL